MTTEPRENPPLPFRWLIVMPWRWGKWTWATLVPILLLVYFLSAVPVLRIFNEQLPAGPQVELLSCIYSPVWAIGAHSCAARAIIDWEDAMMTEVGSLMGLTVIPGQGPLPGLWISTVETEILKHSR